MSLSPAHRTITRWGLLPSFAQRSVLPLPARLLIIGPIGLGDTVLALPALRQLQQASPTTTVAWVGRPAHEPVVRMAGIDDFVSTADLAAPGSKGVALSLDAFDAVLTFGDVAADALGRAGSLNAIPVRIGAANGLRRRWCNHLVHTKRLGFPRHETMRNLRLLLPFGLPTRSSLGEAGALARLAAARVPLPPDLQARGRYAVLHPFSAGHAREWPIGHWMQLACLLADEGVTAIFTGSAEDGALMAAAWPAPARPAGVLDAFGRLDLSQLMTLLVDASAMIACSTGPLHLAASLGAPAIGLFVPRKGLGVDRWAPLGAAAVAMQAHRRCPSKTRCEASSCQCIRDLSVDQVAMTVRSSMSGGPRVDHLPPHWVVSDERRTA
jgi:ADP-heptose:LPS heptosyltransferase